MRDDSLDVSSPLLQTSSQVLIASRAAELWRAVDADLSPVIGRRATLALHRRALFRVRSSLSWLPEPGDVGTLEDGLVQLCAVLETRSVPEARAAACALELNFRELLASLIGASLTATLLRTAWSLHSDEAAAEVANK